MKPKIDQIPVTRSRVLQASRHHENVPSRDVNIKVLNCKCVIVFSSAGVTSFW
jgi:hypothetical protein